jgi:hypothetical protein
MDFGVFNLKSSKITILRGKNGGFYRKLAFLSTRKTPYTLVIRVLLDYLPNLSGTQIIMIEQI